MEYVQFRGELLRLFRSISSAIQVKIKNFEGVEGITPVQALVMMALAQCPGRQKLTDLAKDLQMSNSNLSAICKRLERSGHMKRVRDERDKRIIWAMLTPAAQQLLEKKMEDFLLQMFPAMETLTEEDREDILKGLYKLENILRQEKPL